MFMKTYYCIVIFFCLLSTGCTYHGSLRSDFYQPTTLLQQTEKLPIKALVVVEAKNIHAVGGLGNRYDISLHPGLGKAIQAELATVFEQVRLGEIQDNPQEGEILIRSTLRHRISVDGSSGTATADWEIQFAFRDPRQRIPISSISLQNQSVVHPPVASFIASFITGLCLLICSPITLPWIAQAGGNHAMEVIEADLTEGLHKLPDAIRNDDKILAYAAGETRMQSGSKPRNIGILSSDVDTLPATPSMPQKNAVALVIGIERYRSNLPGADFAAMDAKTMAKYLTGVMGYPEDNVALLLDQNASRADLEKYIEVWVKNRVNKDSSVFIYYSGHGAPNPQNDQAYLVPYDGDPSFLENTGYSLKRLYSVLSELRVKESFVLLDACFSGAGGRSVIAKGVRPMGLSVQNAGFLDGRILVLSASGGDQVANTYLPKGHGLLTYFVLKGLKGEADKDKNGAIDVLELFDYLKPEVERVAKREYNNSQIPQLQGNPELLAKGLQLVGGNSP